MIDEYILKSETLISSSRQEKTIKFASRPFGLFLLGVLCLVWIFDVLFLVYLNVAKPDLSGETLNGDMLVVLGLSLIYLPFLLINIIGFLLWIYKIHQDAGRLWPLYPISPARAVAYVAIPFYNLYGIWKVFKTMSEEFVPGLDLWIYLLYLAHLNFFRSFFFDSIIPDWANQLFTLALTTIWFILTMKVHRALADRVADQMMSEPATAEFAVATALPNQTGSEDISADPYPTPITTEKGRSMSRRLKIGLIAVPLAACMLSACALATFGTLSLAKWFDMDFFGYVMALNDHLATDDSVSNVTAEFSWIQPPGQETEVWLVIGLETPMTCSAGTADPCEILADEIAAFTLKEYARIDEMAGLRVTVITVNEDDQVWMTADFDKHMTIAAWRRELNSPVG